MKYFHTFNSIVRKVFWLVRRSFACTVADSVKENSAEQAGTSRDERFDDEIIDTKNVSFAE